MADEKLHSSKEWQVLKDLAKGNGLQETEKPQLDATLNRKVTWFLYNGAGGVLTLIKEVFGDDGLKDFYDFINYFLSNSDTLGHYYHSDKIDNDIASIRDAVQELDFKKYLSNLKQELIEQDKKKGR